MPIVNGQLRISDDELDRVALAFLKEHQSGVLRKPTRTDLQGITTVVETRFGFHFSVADLAYRGEAKLLGSTDFLGMPKIKMSFSVLLQRADIVISLAFACRIRTKW